MDKDYSCGQACSELNAVMALIVREVLLHGIAVNNLTFRDTFCLKVVVTALINHEHHPHDRQV